MKMTDKIEGYAEMTAEQKLAALEGLDIEESTNNNDSEIQKLKDALNKASSETAGYKKQLREKQTEQERLDAERKEKEAEKDALLEKLLREKNVSEYKASLLDAGFDSELADKSAGFLVDGDMKSFLGNLKTFSTGVKKSVEAELLKKTPDLNGTNAGVSTTISKEQFDNMGYAERVALKQENPDLYNSFTKS